MRPTVKFSPEDAIRAHFEWGANCGPGAVAAIAGLSLSEIRPYFGDFEEKPYTNPTRMWQVLRNLGLQWECRKVGDSPLDWPMFGLARIQWEGPWMEPSVPAGARYARTHWVAAQAMEGLPGKFWIFDINCIAIGGWVPSWVWVDRVVPWVLREHCPRASGRWHITHAVEIQKANGLKR
jgi:hypothetical protein